MAETLIPTRSWNQLRAWNQLRPPWQEQARILEEVQRGQKIMPWWVSAANQSQSTAPNFTVDVSFM